jgi:hypothetical protein
MRRGEERRGRDEIEGDPGECQLSVARSCAQPQPCSKRNPDISPSALPRQVLALYNSWLSDGLCGKFRLSTLEDRRGLGFIFFYEMLTGSLRLTPSRHFSAHGVASVLLRCEPALHPPPYKAL